MKKGGRKILSTVKEVKVAMMGLILLVLVTTAFSSYTVKEEAISEMYQQMGLMNVSLDVKQVTSSITYGINNGKKIDSFYNMGNILNNVLRCSSYIEGVYVTSNEGNLLYTAGLPKEEVTLKLIKNTNQQNGQLFYDTYEDSFYYYVVQAIRDKGQRIQAFTITCMNKEAMKDATKEYSVQNRVESIVITLEVSLLLLFFIWHYRGTETKKALTYFLWLMGIGCMSTFLIDMGIGGYKYVTVITDNSVQSANKIAQSLQSSIDLVTSQGVGGEQVYDLNAWLQQNNAELEMIDTLTVDKNLKIKATIANKYVGELIETFLVQILLLAIKLVVGMAVLYGVIIYGSTRGLVGSRRGTKYRDSVCVEAQSTSGMS